MRNTIKSYNDFRTEQIEPAAKSALFTIRTKNAKFPDDPRYGLVVPKKRFRFAVQRNRAKRLLRDWIAFNQDLMIDEFDYIFFARDAILNSDRETGRDAMRKALNYIKKNHDNSNEK
ncbi:MAG: ribonuclease P protein component [Alphaproteobacteria bacterium]